MHKLSTIVAVAVSSVLMSACGAAGGAEDPSTSPPSKGASGDTLIVYTNSNADGRAEWLHDEAAKAGFAIEVVGQGGGDTTNKIMAERGNPVADVVFGLNHMYFSTLVAGDALEPYEPSWSGDVDADLADPSGDGNFWPLVQQGIVLAYNAEVFSPEEAPQNWTDLWNDERFDGRYESVEGLGGATTQLIFAGILDDYKDPEGDLGISDEGWAQIEGYFEHGSTVVPEKDLYLRIAEGEVDMGQMFTSGIPSRETEFGVDSEIMRPEHGIPFAVEQIAVVKGTDQAERAHEFIDWFGSAETQTAWSAEFDSMPVNKGAIANADPAIVKFHEELKQQEIDWSFAAEHIASWIEKVELEYVP
ncbi:extracellular solute-binding protein [Tessaracoccus antarcticus]|uniref:Extracellular solute-binding protein n=1 Tax=Tessaracoccus antarcticus TaxID=2479848 RepID=A0A3M0GBD6_9ACTN|nr:extracellular solute-binding protein [Tessaracoccus antarcticus]RMB61677.1 extracellular solute-binding protein [Tessaracoccus antarcticus]